jgi:SsrA-binding protein
MTAKNPGKDSGIKLIAQNKKARHLYELLDFFEAGMALVGSEVKSLREGRVSFKDGYVSIVKGEAWLVDVHIAPYANAGPVGQGGHEPERKRKLLLHEAEIKALQIKIEQKGLTIVPVKLYFKNGRVKLEIAVGRGKKLYDRRDSLKEQAVSRDAAREMAHR